MPTPGAAFPLADGADFGWCVPELLAPKCCLIII
jgi:hypothetical protein